MFRVTFTKQKALSLEVYSWWLPEEKNIQVALVPESPINFSSHVTGLVCNTSFHCLFKSFYSSIPHTKFITSKVINNTIFRKRWLSVVLFPLACLKYNHYFDTRLAWFLEVFFCCWLKCEMPELLLTLFSKEGNTKVQASKIIILLVDARALQGVSG